MSVRKQAQEVPGQGRLESDPKSEAGRRTVVLPTVAIEALEEHMSEFTGPDADAIVLMARIGHASPRASLIYQHATEERDREVADFLDDQIATAARRKSAPVEPLPRPNERSV